MGTNVEMTEILRRSKHSEVWTVWFGAKTDRFMWKRKREKCMIPVQY